MKKYAFTVFALFVLGLALPVSAQTQEQETQTSKRFHLGLGHGILPMSDGVNLLFIDLGFRLFHYKTLDIRNHIVFNGAIIHDKDDVTYGVLNLNEKITVGAITRNGLFRPYAYLKGGVGVYRTESKEFFSLPLAFNLGAGGGFTAFVLPNAGFFTELGSEFHIIDNQWLGSSTITLGYIAYF